MRVLFSTWTRHRRKSTLHHFHLWSTPAGFLVTDMRHVAFYRSRTRDRESSLNQRVSVSFWVMFISANSGDMNALCKRAYHDDLSSGCGCGDDGGWDAATVERGGDKGEKGVRRASRQNVRKILGDGCVKQARSRFFDHLANRIPFDVERIDSTGRLESIIVKATLLPTLCEG